RFFESAPPVTELGVVDGVRRRLLRYQFMVPDFVKRLEDKVKALEYELHNELPREIQRARELGDLSENAEYAAAKERQDLVSAQIAQFKRRLGALRMIDFSKIRRDAVGLGSTVKVLDTATGQEIDYELV